MKLMLLAALAAMTLSAQNAKVAETAPSTPAATVPSQRALTEAEVLKVRLDMQKIKNLQDEFKIAEFNKKAQPISDDEQTVFIVACRSVGIPDDKIQSECALNTGYNPDDTPILDKDGKAIQSFVKWNKPAAAEPKK